MDRSLLAQSPNFHVFSRYCERLAFGFKYFTNGQGAIPIPNNYQELLKNNEFVSMLGTRRNVKAALIRYLKKMIEDSNLLRKQIQEELEKINR